MYECDVANLQCVVQVEQTDGPSGRRAAAGGGQLDGRVALGRLHRRTQARHVRPLVCHMRHLPTIITTTAPVYTLL